MHDYVFNMLSERLPVSDPRQLTIVFGVRVAAGNLLSGQLRAQTRPLRRTRREVASARHPLGGREVSRLAFRSSERQPNQKHEVPELLARSSVDEGLNLRVEPTGQILSALDRVLDPVRAEGVLLALIRVVQSLSSLTNIVRGRHSRLAQEIAGRRSSALHQVEGLVENARGADGCLCLPGDAGEAPGASAGSSRTTTTATAGAATGAATFVSVDAAVLAIRMIA